MLHNQSHLAKTPPKVGISQKNGMLHVFSILQASKVLSPQAGEV
jgi:hypothetical protein